MSEKGQGKSLLYAYCLVCYFKYSNLYSVPSRLHRKLVLRGQPSSQHLLLALRGPVCLRTLGTTVSSYPAGTACFKFMLRYLFLCTEKLVRYMYPSLVTNSLPEAFSRFTSWAQMKITFLFLSLKAAHAFIHYSFYGNLVRCLHQKQQRTHKHQECSQKKGVILTEEVSGSSE